MSTTVDTIGIAIDTSGSMHSILKDVCTEAIGIIEKYEPQTVVLCNFSTRFNCSTMTVTEAINKIKSVYSSGSTAMYDGVTTMLHELIPLASEHKKVMAVIITDGIENSSVLFNRNQLVDAKNQLRQIAGSDSIREICISSTIENASNLQNMTPGLSRPHSSGATRDRNSIRNAFRTITQTNTY